MVLHHSRHKPPREGELRILGVVLFILISAWPHLSASEVTLQKQSRAEVDRQVIDCAFAGGMEFSKPILFDIDADGDLDLFVGDQDGQIRYFRNRGIAETSCWELISDFCDSTLGERVCPAFADIDDDKDADLLVGNREGKLVFFENNGTTNDPFFVMRSDFYDSIDVGSESAPFFVDIDSDSDLDLFIGKGNGTLSFYRNGGSPQAASWDLVSENYDSIDVGSNSVPTFLDIDADGDFDLFVGEDQGNLNFFRNVGSDALAQWELASANYNSIDVGKRSAPAFADMNGDSDFDLFLGQGDGRISLYRNDGSVYLPSWTPLAESFLFLDLGAYSSPALGDIDADGDFDLFVGEYDGNVNFYRTEERIPIPACSKITENYFSIEADDYSSPTFADIDGDGDLDLFIGRKDGKMDFYRNIGTAESALWDFIPGAYDFVQVAGYASPAFADIDADGDSDLFIGQTYGKICFYRNGGTPQLPLWTEPPETLAAIDAGWYSSPCLGDLDLDGDLDLMVGNDAGGIYFYENDGITGAFSFLFVTDCYGSIDAGSRSTPTLGDFDSDGDLDLFVGESKGGLHYYRNLTFNSIRGKVTDGANPLEEATVYLSGDEDDSTFTDSSGNYEFVGLPAGDYCVFRDQASFQYCFLPLDSDTFNIDFVGVTHVDEFSEQHTHMQLRLFPNYPNPFNPLTKVSYFLPTDAQVRLTIFNLKGEKVEELVNEDQTKGWKEVTWNGRNSQGNSVASGVYFCKLQANQGSEIIRMILLK